VTPLASLLAERIRRFGPITFAEYMRECLYHPVHGYYSQPESSRFADYYTSPDVHPIFGRLLARQFAEMWEQLDRPSEFLLVEAAAGVGRLANHILEFAELRFPDFYQALRYVAVERSPARCDQLASRLARFVKEGKCRQSIEIPKEVPAGCVFSNELLDALPVHRVVQQEGKLQEISVINDGAGFSEIVQPLSTCEITDYFAALGIEVPEPLADSGWPGLKAGPTIAILQEGQHAEASLEACDWISEVARRLQRGFVLTIDYGHEAADLFDSHHMAGTVLAYAKHQANEGFYAAPGEQDLTAHVNFTALRLWGQRHGLETLGLVSQTQFLLALGQGNKFADLFDPGMDENARVRARLQLKTLIYPEGMGERFQVLVQQKSVPAARLTALLGL
jgi:SAM-dependent MidA family methyltransferase